MADLNRFHTLDGLRGLAAAAVVAYHIGQHSEGGAWLAASGYLAVDFFLLLSGFVIARAYETRLRAGMGLARFAQIRLVRLYPLFLLGIVIALVKPVLQIATGDDTAPAPVDLGIWFGMGALMLPAPDPYSLFPLNSPAWSLFMEVVVNLAYASLLVVLTTRVLWVVAAACAAVLAVGVLQAGTADLGWGWQTIGYGFARVGFSFALGVIFARMGVGGQRQRTWWALVPMAVLVAVLIAPLPADLRGPLNLAAVLLVFPLLMMVAARTEAPAGLQRFCSFAGDVSYPLYAIHFPLMLLYLAVSQRLIGFDLMGSIWFLPVSVLAAWLALKLYDEPVRQALTRVLAPRAAAMGAGRSV